MVFGLANALSLNGLDDEQEADDERARRTRIDHIQTTLKQLRSANPTWRYLDAPRDVLVIISPSHDNLTRE